MTGSEPGKTCLFCERDSTLVPLISLDYQGANHYICTQHFPVLIHDPGRLAGKLPGAEGLAPTDIQK